MKEISSESKFSLQLLISILKLPFLIIMFPFSKKARSQITQPIKLIKQFLSETKITTTLITINVIIYIIELFTPANILNSIVTLNLKITNIIIIDKFLCTFLTWFMHANLSHLLGNMLALLIFGRVIEKYIKNKYLLIYFISAFIGSLISVFFTQYGLGASAAISGLILTGILIRPFYITFLTIIPLPIFLIGWISIYADLSGAYNQIQNGIGYLAHVGGYIGALITSLLLIKTSKEKYEIKKGLIINIILLLIFLIIKLKN